MQTNNSGDFAELIASIGRGEAPPMTDDRRVLAEAAVDSNHARKDEDIDTWSNRLAAASVDADLEDAKRVIEEAGEDPDLIIAEAAQNVDALHGSPIAEPLLFDSDEASDDHWAQAKGLIAKARRLMPAQASDDDDPDPIV